MSAQEAGSCSPVESARSRSRLSGRVAPYINIYITTTVLPSVVKDIWWPQKPPLCVEHHLVCGRVYSWIGADREAARGGGVARCLWDCCHSVLAGSLICALAPNMPVMLAGRALQGLGGGFLFALCYTMIYAVFEERLWPRAMALISGMWGVATLVGPAIGGIFAEMEVWRAAFGMLIPVSVLYLRLVWRVLPARDDAAMAGRPPWGQLLLLTAAVLVVSVASTSPEPARALLGLGLAVVLMSGLVWLELSAVRSGCCHGMLRLSSPLLPLYITIGLLMIGMTSEDLRALFLAGSAWPDASGVGLSRGDDGGGLDGLGDLEFGMAARSVRRAVCGADAGAGAGMAMLAASIPLPGQRGWRILGLIERVGAGGFWDWAGLATSVDADLAGGVGRIRMLRRPRSPRCSCSRRLWVGHGGDARQFGRFECAGRERWHGRGGGGVGVHAVATAPLVAILSAARVAVLAPEGGDLPASRRVAPVPGLGAGAAFTHSAVPGARPPRLRTRSSAAY